MRKFQLSCVGLAAAAALLAPASSAIAGDKGSGKNALAKANLKGDVVSVDGSVVTVLVEKANAHGRGCVGRTLSFDVSSAKVRVADVNGDGLRDVSDFVAGDRVKVKTLVPRVRGKERKTTCGLAEGEVAIATKIVNKGAATEEELLEDAAKDAEEAAEDAEEAAKEAEKAAEEAAKEAEKAAEEAAKEAEKAAEEAAKEAEEAAKEAEDAKEDAEDE